MEKWAIGAVRVLTAAICVKVYVGDVFLGMGPSMEPTLPDRVIFLVEKLSLRWRPATVGDVVVVSSPTRANGSMCKRIIAMVQTKCIRRTTTNNEQILGTLDRHYKVSKPSYASFGHCRNSPNALIK
ncbi:hypothetical protein DYB25_000914, partial [Aphanomyces astaci]